MQSSEFRKLKDAGYLEPGKGSKGGKNLGSGAGVRDKQDTSGGG